MDDGLNTTGQHQQSLVQSVW